MKTLSPEDLVNAMGFPPEAPGELDDAKNRRVNLLKAKKVDVPSFTDVFAFDLLEKCETVDIVKVITSMQAEKEKET